MALNIKNEEAERLARDLARRRGAKITHVIIDALKAEMKRERAKARPDDEERMQREVREIQRRFAALPVLDDRSDDEILGYDEHGLPT